MAAAQEALLEFAEVVCRTVEAHPEWRDEARAKVAEAQAEAEEARWLVQHLERAASDELYPATRGTVPRDEPDLVWDVKRPGKSST